MLAETVCPSGLRGWTQVPLAQAAWVQIPQLSFALAHGRRDTAEKYFAQTTKTNPGLPICKKSFAKKGSSLPKRIGTRFFQASSFFPMREERDSSPQGPNCNSFLTKNATQRPSQMQHKGLGLKSQCSFLFLLLQQSGSDIM
jgi:hypothetical protein